MKQHGLGRLPSPEDRRDFKMGAAVRELEKLPRPVKRWSSRGPVLDQGDTQACVGYSWAGWGISAPVEDHWGNAEGAFIYKSCKQLDKDPRDGTTIRTGAKVMKRSGRLGTYFWAASVDEALDYVARFGPVLAGTLWTEGMFKPGSLSNVIRPTGKLVGGHAWLIVGVDAKYVILRNSWGAGWGRNGCARLAIADLETLFTHGGELCAATELALPIGGK